MNYSGEMCLKHGKLKVPVCPECGMPVEVYSRPCGYLRPVSCWNDGKQQEFAERKTFMINEGDHAD